MAVKLNGADNYEPIHVTITEREQPISYNNKIDELVEQGLYPNREEAKKDNQVFHFDMEMYYQKHSGMFIVEEGAVETGTIYSPYDGEICDDYEEEEEE